MNFLSQTHLSTIQASPFTITCKNMMIVHKQYSPSSTSFKLEDRTPWILLKTSPGKCNLSKKCLSTLVVASEKNLIWMAVKKKLPACLFKKFYLEYWAYKLCGYGKFSSMVLQLITERNMCTHTPLPVPSQRALNILFNWILYMI